MAIELPENEVVNIPKPGKQVLFLNGTTPKLLKSDGTQAAVAGGGNTILQRAQVLLPNATLSKILGPADFDGSHVFTEATGTAGTGSALMSATAKGGVVKVASGATSSSLIQICAPGTAVATRGMPALIDNARTTPWYFYVQFALPTGTDAAGAARAQLAAISSNNPAAPTIGVGLCGDVSTTNFAYRVANSSNVVVASGSGPVLDTNQHVAELANDGTTLTVLFDGVSIGTTPATNIGAVPMSWVIAALNGATAANREIDVDALYVVV